MLTPRGEGPVNIAKGIRSLVSEVVEVTRHDSVEEYIPNIALPDFVFEVE